MLTVTEAAGSYLADLLTQANAPDDTAIRFVLKDDTITPQVDHERPGDTTFEHAGSTILVLDASLSTVLEEKTLDVQETDDGLQLILLQS